MKQIYSMLSAGIIIVILVVSAFVGWAIYKIFTVRTYQRPLHEDSWDYVVN